MDIFRFPCFGGVSALHRETLLKPTDYFRLAATTFYRYKFFQIVLLKHFFLLALQVIAFLEK